MTLRHSLCGLALVLAILSLTGCGGGSGPRVSGTVTYAGEPVEDGSITFHDPDGKHEEKGGARIVGGKYLAENNPKLTPGRYRVEISWMKSTGRKAKNADPDVTPEDRKQVIPPKYNKQSTLLEEVKSGANTINFNLEK